MPRCEVLAPEQVGQVGQVGQVEPGEQAGQAELAPVGPTRQGLGGSVVRSARWSAGSKLVVQLVQFVLGIVLARILVPTEFGLVASVLVISNFALLFFELGFGQALVQARNPSEELKATVFWVNLLGGFVFLAALAAAAPLIADFYGQPQLVSITPLVALSFTASFGVVHRSMLQKQMAFTMLGIIDVASAVTAAAVTIACTLAGAGAYALAVGPVAAALLSSLLVTLEHPWRPRARPSMAALREIWRFSGGLLGFNVFNYWGRNADNLLVGRFDGAGPLAYYSRSYNLMLLPVYQVTGAIGNVVFTAMSAFQDDHERARSAYVRTVRSINLLTVPALLILAATSDAVVPLLWGDRWLSAVPLLQVLCVAGVPQCVTTTVGWIYQSQNRTGLAFRMNVLWTLIGVAFMLVGLHWGAQWVAVAVLARYWLAVPWNLDVAGSLIGLTAWAILRGSVPVFVASSMAAVAAYALPFVAHVDRHGVATLLAQLAVAAGIFFGVMSVVGRDALAEVRTLARRS